MSVPLAAYGPHHTESRKLMQSSIGGKRVDSLNAVQEEKTLYFLRALVEDPENFLDHIRR